MIADPSLNPLDEIVRPLLSALFSLGLKEVPVRVAINSLERFEVAWYRNSAQTLSYVLATARCLGYAVSYDAQMQVVRIGTNLGIQVKFDEEDPFDASALDAPVVPFLRCADCPLHDSWERDSHRNCWVMQGRTREREYCSLGIRADQPRAAIWALYGRIRRNQTRVPVKRIVEIRIFGATLGLYLVSPSLWRVTATGCEAAYYRDLYAARSAFWEALRDAGQAYFASPPSNPSRPTQRCGHVLKLSGGEPDWCPECRTHQKSEVVVDQDNGDVIYVLYACGDWVNAIYTHHELVPPVKWTAESEEFDYVCYHCGKTINIWEVGEPCFDYGCG